MIIFTIGPIYFVREDTVCGWTITLNGVKVYLGLAQDEPKIGPQAGDTVFDESSLKKCILLLDGSLKPIGVFCMNHCMGDMSINLGGRLFHIGG